MSEFDSTVEPQPPVLSGIPRRKSRQGVVAWGDNRVTVGGDAPVRVQSMTNTDTADVIGTAIQVKELAQAGSELVRITVNNEEAAALYDELERAVQAGEADKVQRVWADVQAKAGRAQQGQQAGLLAASSLHGAGKAQEARQALAWVIDQSSDSALIAVARLRLAGLELEAKDYERALKTLDFKASPEFAPLLADRRGDVLQAQGQSDAARTAYRSAWDGLASAPEYRRIVQAKLNALGFDPESVSTPTQE